MDCNKIVFTGHSIRQMFSRSISKENVINVINNGEVIVEYPDDKPYPCYLMLGFIDSKPIHIVLAFNKEERTCIVVTSYIPSSELWAKDFRERKK